MNGQPRQVIQNQPGLLDEQLAEPINLLPTDGLALYFGKILSPQQSSSYLQSLRQRSDWKNDRLVIYGRTITTRRQIAWYGDNPYTYSYSGNTHRALSWHEEPRYDELLTLRELIQQQTRTRFNSCLLNLYHDGSEGMSWHSDDEPELKPNGTIASLSLGSPRKFAFRHKKTRQIISVVLEPGSLLVMKGSTQRYWQHCLRTSKKITEPRINLTFRQFVR